MLMFIENEGVTHYIIMNNYLNITIMKKYIFTMVMCLFTVALVTSCSSSNTPKGVAEKAAKCLKSKDFKGLVKLVDMPDEERDGFATMMEEKASKNLDKKDGISSFEILEEDVNEVAGTARVKVKYIYGNGEEETETMKLVKKDGDWKLSMRK